MAGVGKACFLRRSHRHCRAFAEGAEEHDAAAGGGGNFSQHAAGAQTFVDAGIGRVQRARELLMLGTAIDGRSAVEWGLGHRAVAAAAVDATAHDLAAQLASGPTVSLGLTKWMLQTSAEHTLEQHLRDEAFAMELSSRSEDFREGLSAFKEKRDPDFKGR